LREYFYSPLVKTYVDFFGAEQVLVLPMELLASEPGEFFATLEKFAGVREFWRVDNDKKPVVENRSPGRLGIQYQRTIKGIKHLYRHIGRGTAMPSEALEAGPVHDRIMRLIERIDRPMRPMSASTASWLDDYYRDDNSTLMELTGLDLSEYEYAC
jgi:hypothetical protein